MGKDGYNTVKTNRHKAILDIISQYEICTQESLLDKLKEQDFDVTQATVSRDIKVLDLVKSITANGKYKYAQRTDNTAKKNAVKFKAVFIETVISVDYAINTVVIKCHVGMANAACAALDLMGIDDIVGTLAGDDTIFILLRSEEAAKTLVNRVSEMLEK